MSKVCESWSLEDLVEMDEEDMEELLKFYQSGAVPSFETVRLGDQDNVFVFDGSFGWW
jgi:precorrin-2 dehydrogenase / sirohydrochlorin ferrochelatase